MIQFLSATGSASMTETLFTLLPMILIIVFMFILIYLPQKRQDKKDAAMRSSIEIGDKVSTIGGIVGIELLFQKPIDEGPVSEVGGNASGRSMRLRDIAFFFQHGKLVAHRGR